MIKQLLFKLRLPLFTVNTLALHGPLPRQAEFEAVFPLLCQLLAGLNAKASFIDVDSANDPNQVEPIEFESWARRGKPNLIRAETVGVTILASMRSFGIPLAVASFSNVDKGFSLSFDCHISHFTRPYFEDVAKQVWERYRFEYGYALQLPRTLSSWHYGGASIGDRSDYKDGEIDRRRLWLRHFTNRPSSGTLFQLRNVYPLNFLSRGHLDQNIEGKSLQEWISADAAHGQLSAVNSAITLWTVEREQLETAKRALGSAGLLVEHSVSQVD